MKIRNPSSAGKRNRQSGFVAVIVMMILLGLIVTFIATNIRVLANLHGEMKMVERKQIRRLDQASTNTPAASQTQTNINFTAPANPAADR